MANMSYRALKRVLEDMTDDQFDQSVTVYLNSQDEFFPVTCAKVYKRDGVLDAGHTYLVVPS